MKTRLAIWILILVAVLVAAAPVSATREWVGERILVDGSAQEFPAGEPFHIGHGWQVDPRGSPGCRHGWDFGLVWDPCYYETGGKHSVEPLIGSGPPPTLAWQRVYEFEDGMTGVVTFTGVWYVPCQVAVDAGWWPGPCSSHCAPVPVHTRSTTVTFTE